MKKIYPKIGYVYYILCKKTKEKYIGSSFQPNVRIRNHWNMLKKGWHELKKIRKLVQEYGPDQFEIDVK